MLLISACGILNFENEQPEIPGKLVFSALDEHDRYQIYSSLTNGAQLKNLTNFKNDEAYNPSWSNDGTQIVFVTSLRNTSEGGSLYIMNADGSNLRPMKERPNTNVVTLGGNPVWSPDDSKIAFDFCPNCEVGGRNTEIYVYDFEKDTVTKITSHPAGDYVPTWGNSVNKLFFSTDRDYALLDTLRFRRDIYSYDISNQVEKRITTSGNATNPVLNWSTNHLLHIWNVQENTISCSDSTNKDFSILETSLEYSGTPAFSKTGKMLFVIGRKNDQAIPEMILFNFSSCNDLGIVGKQSYRGKLKDSRRVDWYYDDVEK